MLNVTCPGCQTRLRIPDSLLGRKAKCNKCGAILKIPAAAVTAKAPAAPPAPPVRPAVVEEVAGEPVRARRRPRDEDEEEFDEEERPRRRRQAKKSPVLLISLLSGAAVLLIAVGVGAFFLLRGKGGGNVPGGALELMPDNSAFMASVRLGDIRRSAAWQDLVKEIPEINTLLNKAGGGDLSPADIETLVIGGTPHPNNMGGNGGTFVAVFEMSKPFSANDIMQRKPGQRFETKTVAGQTVYEGPTESFCMLTDRKILAGSTGPMVRTVLERKGPPQQSAKLRAALADVDFNRAVAVAADVGALPKNAMLPGGLGPAGFGPGAFGPKGQQEMPETLAVDVQTAKQVTIRAYIGFKDANGPQATVKQFEDAKKQLPMLALLGIPRELIDVANKAQVAAQGTKLTVSTSFEVGPMARGLKGLVQKFMPGGAPNPFGGGAPNPFGGGQPKMGQFPPVGPGGNPFPVPKGGNPFPAPKAGGNKVGANAFPKAGWVTGPGHVLLKAMAGLRNQDPPDRVRQNPHKVHTVEMLAGKTYVIDLQSSQFDSYLRLEDSTGKQLAEDDDGGGYPNARIQMVAPTTDHYRIIVTSYRGGTGNYYLTVRQLP